MDLESRETIALKERDSEALNEIWARDFTLDNTASILVDGESAVPNYMSVGRLIENFVVINANTVSTSGIEYLNEVRNGKIVNVELPFFHTWTRSLSGWKLTTKSKN